MAHRPVIGVTGPDRGGLFAWWMTALAVRRNGGKPLRIRPSKPCDAGRLDGLIVGGGADVGPFQHEEEPEEDGEDDPPDHLFDWVFGIVLAVARMLVASGSRQRYEPERDELEQRLILLALDEDLPALGICRGAQLMNVVLGGTLHRDIRHFYTEDTTNVRSVLPRKRIDIADDSHLRGILDTRCCSVNALHNQSVKELGHSVVVSARERSGVVQAIEHRVQRFFIGVQWHPEYMPQSRTQQNLFRELLRHAGRS